MLTQSDAINIDNQCDQPVASELNVTPFDEEDKLLSGFMVGKSPEKPKSKRQQSKEEIDLSLLEESIPSVEVEDIFDNGNMLDSLREQLKVEDEKNKINGEDFKERSSSEFNMPFEVNPRDSQNTGLRSSGLINVSTR